MFYQQLLNYHELLLQLRVYHGFYEKRYEKLDPQIISTTMRDSWTPDSVFLEAMFLINITSWTAHRTMGDYANFLLKQQILPYQRTTPEVHVLLMTRNAKN